MSRRTRAPHLSRAIVFARADSPHSFWLPRSSILEEIMRLINIVAAMCLVVGPMSCQSPVFVTIAEGMTSDRRGSRIEVAYRMFSLPGLPQLCSHSGTVANLVSTKGRIDLRVNERFPLTVLDILALNIEGKEIPKVPIAIEIERTLPALIDFSPASLYRAGLRPIGVGRFRLRVRTFCPGPGVEISIPVTIHSR